MFCVSDVKEQFAEVMQVPDLAYAIASLNYGLKPLPLAIQ